MDDTQRATLDACGKAFGYLLAPLLSAIINNKTPDPEELTDRLDHLVYDTDFLTEETRAVMLGVMEGISVAIHTRSSDPTARL